jgi:predicted NAD/FAD-dependent oxidoreductase
MPRNPETRPADDRIAVIGAGLSGLTCAHTLAAEGLDVKVTEKARGPGGRMSTRRADDRRFDHGAQYFTARDPQFSQQVDSWRQRGLVEEWAAKIAVLDHGSVTIKADTTERYVGVPGMNAICRDLADGLDVIYRTEVRGLERSRAGWSLIDADGAEIGVFDTVVVSAPAEQSSRLLDHAASGLASQARSVEMAPCWATMVGFARPLETEFDGAFVVDSPLSWVARNTSKPGRPSGENWVLHASPEWSQRHLETERESAAEDLFEAFKRALGRPIDTPVHLAAHRWRFALPTEPLAQACLVDPDLRVVACGDWCGGPRVEGAFLSGLEAARRVARFGVQPRRRQSGKP